eukprot:TRINITY_DN1224_c0_g4_i3.p2 TRINITY_DN1224_c0_g4~~TRINITY_DN1224_c0_g4_i3.p2  ORF type:complete len:115 (+),score=5.46 TRINITY_DN1224_c0_g4_i3:73-417(+)
MKGGSRPSQPVVITQLPLDRVQPVIGRPSVVRPGSVPVTQLLSGRTGVHTTTTGDTSTSSRRLSRRSTSSFSSDSPRSRSLLCVIVSAGEWFGYLLGIQEWSQPPNTGISLLGS